MRKLLLILLLNIVFESYSSWVQVGQDIDGEYSNDRSGTSISLSKDGNILAIGARANDDNGVDAGHVRVYQWNGSIWDQLGEDIDGFSEDASGTSISLSEDGMTIAVGSPTGFGWGMDTGLIRVYQWNGLSWVQMGNYISGNGVYFGNKVSLSSDGLVLAVGGTGSTGSDQYTSLFGVIRVYQWNGLSWVQMGNTIDGDSLSHKILNSFSSDGSRFSISMRERIRVYEWNGSLWNQIGNDIQISQNSSNHYPSSSLNSDGTIIAVGDSENDENGNNTGQIQLFEWNGLSWVQIGNNINGEYGEHIGDNLILNANGSKIAFSDMGSDLDGNIQGHVKLYGWNGLVWDQIGDNIDGEGPDDRASSVSLSHDASLIAIGAWANSDNGYLSGHVRIFLSNSAADFDGDGLSDFMEIYSHGTDTNSVDTDGDGWSDYFEVNFTFSATNSDSIAPSNDLIIARSELNTLSNEIVTLASETNRLRNEYLIAFNAVDEAQNQAEQVLFALQISSNQVAELTFTNNQLQEAMGVMLTSNDAYAMLDSAYVDDMVMIVSNNTASIIQVIEQSSNLTVGAWDEVRHITNTVPLDTDAGFFRFKLAE